LEMLLETTVGGLGKGLLVGKKEGEWTIGGKGVVIWSGNLENVGSVIVSKNVSWNESSIESLIVSDNVSRRELSIILIPEFVMESSRDRVTSRELSLTLLLFSIKESPRDSSDDISRESLLGPLKEPSKELSELLLAESSSESPTTTPIESLRESLTESLSESPTRKVSPRDPWEESAVATEVRNELEVETGLFWNILNRVSKSA